MAIPLDIQKLREYLDAHTPNLSMLGNLAGGPMWYALQGAAQPDIVKPTKRTQEIAAAQVAAAAPKAPQATPSNWGLYDYGGQQPSAPPASTDWRASTQAPLNLMPSPSAPAAPTANAAPVVQPASVPLPQARPASAPQAPAPAPSSPDIGFFQRNALMMRDPSSGDFIDPSGAAQAARGPDLINKMIQYLHDKDMG